MHVNNTWYIFLFLQHNTNPPSPRPSTTRIYTVMLRKLVRYYRFIFWVYRGEYFSSSTWGKSDKFIIVDGGDRTHDPKAHGLSTTPFVKELVGY